MVEDNPELIKIILWTDCYIPQKRNYILSYAIHHFFSTDQYGKKLEVIEHKYSKPGHGNLQKIDCSHSCTEQYFRDLEISSHLVRVWFICLLYASISVKYCK